MSRNLIKAVARFLFGNYQVFRIYTYTTAGGTCQDSPLKEFEFIQVPQDQISNSVDEVIRDRAWYHGENSDAFACLYKGRIVALCFFWHGERYRTERNFWPLAEKEAKLVEIITLPEMRGKGLAKSLIAYAEHEMFSKGYQRLYARIWHTNTPSIRAFENAGWQYLTTVIEVRLLGFGKPLRLKFKTL